MSDYFCTRYIKVKNKNFVAVGTFVAIGPVVANNEVHFGYVETTINILPKART